MPDDYDDAVGRVHDLVAGEPSLGPHELDDEGDAVLDAPIPGAVLSEWVLMMSWVDPVTGQSTVTRATSTNLPRHHEQGLLHEGLHGFD